MRKGVRGQGSGVSRTTAARDEPLAEENENLSRGRRDALRARRDGLLRFIRAGVYEACPHRPYASAVTGANKRCLTKRFDARTQRLLG